MSQYNFGNLESPLSGADLVNTHLEPWRDAVHTTHSGTSRPGYVVAGMVWLNTTTSPWVMNIFDGAQDIPLFTINTSTNVASPAGISFSAFIQTLLDDVSAAAARTTLGVVIGADVQAYNAILQLVSGLTAAANKGIYFTGSGSMATFDLTAAGRALLDDADVAAQWVTLGLGTAAGQNYGTGANQLVRLDGTAKLPAVDGSQLTGIGDGVTIFDSTLNSATSQDFTWTAGIYRRVLGFLTNAAYLSTTAAGGRNLIARIIDNGSVISSANYLNKGYIEGVYSANYERTNGFTMMPTNGLPAAEAPGMSVNFEIAHLNDYPLFSSKQNGPSGTNTTEFTSGYNAAIGSCSGIQLLVSQSSRNMSPNTRFLLKGYP